MREQLRQLQRTDLKGITPTELKELVEAVIKLEEMIING